MCIGFFSGGLAAESSTTGAAGALSATVEVAPAAFPASAVDVGSASIVVVSDTADVPSAAFTALSTTDIAETALSPLISLR